MKRTALSIGMLLVAALPGCYAHIKIPLDEDLDRTQLGDKVGESSVQSVLWLVAWGDGGTQAAAREGGITTITHADREIFAFFLGLYYERKTIVYGE